MWSTVNGNASVSASGIVSGISVGVDTVLYSVSNSCGTVAATQPLEIDGCDIAGVGQVSLNPVFSIYPNPSSSIVNIKWIDLPAGNAEIIISDAPGRVVMSETFVPGGAHSKQLDLSGLKDGVYLLKIRSGASYFTSKLVLSK